MCADGACRPHPFPSKKLPHWSAPALRLSVAIDAGLKVVNNTLSSNFVRPDEANKAQSMLKDKGKHTFIDKVQVRYVSDDDKHWAELKNFGHKHVHIPEHFLRDYDRLLMGGIGHNWIFGIDLMRRRRASVAHFGLIT